MSPVIVLTCSLYFTLFIIVALGINLKHAENMTVIFEVAYDMSKPAHLPNHFITCIDKDENIMYVIWTSNNKTLFKSYTKWFSLSRGTK